MSASPMNWQWLTYDALSRDDLYALLQLRSEVFVVEQHCVFQDLDGDDVNAMHLLGRHPEAAGALWAYARCFAAGVKFAEASIGRVVTRGPARGAGIGHDLMTAAIQAVCRQWGVQPIRIGAQVYLHKFYTRHGFMEAGPRYLEDGIEHIEMLWQPSLTGDFL